MEVELTVKGEIEVLRLMPSDIVVVHLTDAVSSYEATQVGEQVHRILKAAGHANEVMLVSRGVRLEVTGNGG